MEVLHVSENRATELTASSDWLKQVPLAVRAKYLAAMREAKQTEARVSDHWSEVVQQKRHRIAALEGHVERLEREADRLRRKLREADEAYGSLCDYIDLMESPAWDNVDWKRDHAEIKREQLLDRIGMDRDRLGMTRSDRAIAARGETERGVEDGVFKINGKARELSMSQEEW